MSAHVGHRYTHYRTQRDYVPLLVTHRDISSHEIWSGVMPANEWRLSRQVSPRVSYVCLFDDQVFTRPLSEWDAVIKLASGVEVPRFARVDTTYDERIAHEELDRLGVPRAIDPNGPEAMLLGTSGAADLTLSLMGRIEKLGQKHAAVLDGIRQGRRDNEHRALERADELEAFLRMETEAHDVTIKCREQIQAVLSQAHATLDRLGAPRTMLDMTLSLAERIERLDGQRLGNRGAVMATATDFDRQLFPLRPKPPQLTFIGAHIHPGRKISLTYRDAGGTRETEPQAFVMLDDPLPCEFNHTREDGGVERRIDGVPQGAPEHPVVWPEAQPDMLDDSASSKFVSAFDAAARSAYPPDGVVRWRSDLYAQKVADQHAAASILPRRLSPYHDGDLYDFKARVEQAEPRTGDDTTAVRVDAPTEDDLEKGMLTLVATIPGPQELADAQRSIPLGARVWTARKPSGVEQWPALVLEERKLGTTGWVRSVASLAPSSYMIGDGTGATSFPPSGVTSYQVEYESGGIGWHTAAELSVLDGKG